MNQIEEAFHISRVSSRAHTLYRALVDAFLATGSVPDVGISDELAELEREDWVALDEDGRVSVLYPYSVVPSGIAVEVNGVERHAMCAIDALGIAAMLQASVQITAACPASGTPLHINVLIDGKVTFDPADAVVVRRRTGGAAHVSRCAATRFFRSARDAEEWVARNGDPGDVVLDLAEAYREAAAIFGRAYSDGVRLVL